MSRHNLDMMAEKPLVMRPHRTKTHTSVSRSEQRPVCGSSHTSSGYSPLLRTWTRWTTSSFTSSTALNIVPVPPSRRSTSSGSLRNGLGQVAKRYFLRPCAIIHHRTTYASESKNTIHPPQPHSNRVAPPHRDIATLDGCEPSVPPDGHGARRHMS